MMYFLFTLITLFIACVASADAFTIEALASALPVLTATATSITLPASKWRYLVNKSVGRMAQRGPNGHIMTNRLLLYNRNNLLHAGAYFAGGFFSTAIGQALPGLNGLLGLSLPEMKAAIKGASAKQEVALQLAGSREAKMLLPNGTSINIDAMYDDAYDLDRLMLANETKINMGLRPSEELMKAIRVAANTFASRDDLKPTLQSVCIEAYPDEQWRVLATDAHKAFIQTSNSNLDAHQDKAIARYLLDAEVLRKLLTSDVVALSPMEYIAECSAFCAVHYKDGSDMMCKVPLIDGRFPSIDNVLESNAIADTTPSMMVNAQAWADAVKPHVKKKGYRMLTIEPGENPIAAELKEDGEMAGTLMLEGPAMGANPIAKFAVNPDYMLDCLQGYVQISEQQELMWHQEGPNASIHLLPASNMDAPVQMLLMPVMIGVSY